MHPSNVLSLISDLYGQVAALQQENEQLRQRLVTANGGGPSDDEVMKEAVATAASAVGPAREPDGASSGKKDDGSGG